MILAKFRKPTYFIGAFALLGLVLLPAVFYVLSETVPDYRPFPFQILLWPSSFGFMAIDGAVPWDPQWTTVFAILAGVNGLLYGTIGTLLWIGLYKWRWVLILLVVVLVWGLYQFVDTFFWDLKSYWDHSMGPSS